MRKPRDYDSELKALSDKARSLKAKRVEQLGELVVATGADALDLEVLAGILCQGILEAKLETTREAWRKDGAAFFQRRRKKGGGTATIDGSTAQPQPGGDATGGSDAAANR